MTEEKLNRLLDKLGILEIRNNPDKFEDYIANLDYETFEKNLIFINGFLRQTSQNNREIETRPVGAGNLIAPEEEIKKIILEDSFNAIKKMDNSKARATFMYHMLNELHLFLDGNGRTSRFVYNFLNKEDILFDNTLEETKKSEIKVSRSRIFESIKNIVSTKQAFSTTSKFLFEEMVANGEISKNINPNLKEVQTQSTTEVKEYNSIILPDKIKEELTQNEIFKLRLALQDNNERFSISGLSVIKVLSEKEKENIFKRNILKKAIKNQEKIAKKNHQLSNVNQLIMNLPTTTNTNPNYNILSKWEAKDYRRLLVINKSLKERLFLKYIDLNVHKNFDPRYAEIVDYNNNPTKAIMDETKAM